MFGIEITVAPAMPFTAEAARAFLRLNDTSEDTLLGELIAAAVDQFETDTKRPVLATTYRQFVTRWPSPLVLGRGGVTAIGAVMRYLENGSTQSVSGWTADLKTPPARVLFGAVPDLISVASGVVSPAGHVEFTAGWANAAAVPKLVLTALKLLVSHWYEHREAFLDGTLTELPMGWSNVCAKYRLGLSGDWGQ